MQVLGDKKDTKISTRPFQLVTGRHWVGVLNGNMKARSDFKELHEMATTKVTKMIIESSIVPEKHHCTIDEFPEKAAAHKSEFERITIKFN
jgi:Zn-dependent alcohol dehydrogenase